MERWDFDCQKCGHNIGDAWYVDDAWYACPQEAGTFKALKAVYPRFYFDYDGNVVSGDVPDKTAMDDIVGTIKRYALSGRTVFAMCLDGSGHNISYDVYGADRYVVWYDASLPDGKYYKKARIKKHTIKGRGRGRLGYCFCEICAKQLNYACPVCGSKLTKVVADEHPGGEWGIRGVREPAPMC